MSGIRGRQAGEVARRGGEARWCRGEGEAAPGRLSAGVLVKVRWVSDCTMDVRAMVPCGAVRMPGWVRRHGGEGQTARGEG